MAQRIIALIACLFVGAATAAPVATAYDVEVLVFETLLPQLEGGEVFSRNGGAAPDIAGAVLADTVATEGTLANAATLLQREGAHRVLLHQRWRQAAEEKSASKPVRLRSADGQLDGSLRFYLSRFLHVDVDVAMQDRAATVGENNYRLTEHRRIKTQELNYFDHPKLGVLLRVTAVGKE
jgi:hypothetical protein